MEQTELRIYLNKDLRTALHDEMYVKYKHRSIWIGFLASISLMLVTTPLSVFKIIPYEWAVNQLIFWIGLLTISISWLILNRNRR